ncbi:MAG: DsrE family protein [Bacteroidales bacterium]
MINSHNNPDTATVGFVVAGAALGSEKETTIFLSTDAVWLAVKGEAEKISIGEPFKPLKELVDAFIANGGRILACAPCLKTRGITEDMLIDGVTPAGGAVLVELLSEGTPCITY